MLALRFSMTDEGFYLARLAHRAPGHQQLVVRHATMPIWDQGREGGAIWADDIGEAVAEAIDWIVV